MALSEDNVPIGFSRGQRWQDSTPEGVRLVQLFEFQWVDKDHSQIRVGGPQQNSAVVGGESRGNVGIQGVNDSYVALTKTSHLQRTGECVVRYQKLQQVNIHTLDVLRAVTTFQDDGVVIIGKVSGNECSDINARCRQSGQRIHLGHGGTIEFPYGLEADGFDVGVDLHKIDQARENLVRSS